MLLRILALPRWQLRGHGSSLLRIGCERMVRAAPLVERRELFGCERHGRARRQRHADPSDHDPARTLASLGDRAFADLPAARTVELRLHVRRPTLGAFESRRGRRDASPTPSLRIRHEVSSNCRRGARLECLPLPLPSQSSRSQTARIPSANTGGSGLWCRGLRFIRERQPASLDSVPELHRVEREVDGEVGLVVAHPSVTRRSRRAGRAASRASRRSESRARRAPS